MSARKRRSAVESAKTPAFVARAERAFGRASKNVIAEHRALNMPVIVWENGKVVKRRV